MHMTIPAAYPRLDALATTAPGMSAPAPLTIVTSAPARPARVPATVGRRARSRVDPRLARAWSGPHPSGLRPLTAPALGLGACLLVAYFLLALVLFVLAIIVRDVAHACWFLLRPILGVKSPHRPVRRRTWTTLA